MASQAQNPIQRLIGLVDELFFDQAPPPAKPVYSITAMLQRSLLHEQIQEDKAKLETFRAQECEFRALLVAAYATMAYEAERAKFSMETRKWNFGALLNCQYDAIQKALKVHGDCQKEIARLEKAVTEAQGELEDAELWEGV